jgi:hypothetical protein
MCPAGKVVISGGFRTLVGTLAPGDGTISIVTSAPNAANTGWEVLVFNNSQFNAILAPYAICANAS